MANKSTTTQKMKTLLVSKAIIANCPLDFCGVHIKFWQNTIFSKDFHGEKDDKLKHFNSFI